MQIGHSNHIHHPGVGNQTPATLANLVSGEDTNSADAAAAAPGKGRGAAVRQMTPAQTAPGVVAKIQSGSEGAAGVSLPPGLVYSNARKAAPEEVDANADTARMQEQHRQAMERTAGTPSRLALDKDGVLVAKPAHRGGHKDQDFVSFAVGAMREYADEQARLKAQSTQTETAATHLIPRNLGEVQKLAARFKMFG